MGKECRTCVFNSHSEKCKMLHERIEKNCWAWADEAEYARREKDVENYFKLFNGILESAKKLPKEQIQRRQKKREENFKKRGGKSIKEVLDVHFLENYEKGMNDKEIGDLLGIDMTRVRDYRHDNDFPPQYKKNRPALTGTA